MGRLQSSLAKLFAGVLLVPIVSAFLSAQPGTFYVLGAGQTRTELPKVTAKLQNHGKLFYVAGYKVSFEIAGERAPLRLNAADARAFIEEVQSPCAPNCECSHSYAQLVKLQVNHGKREWVTSDMTMVPFYGTGHNNYAGVSVNIEPYGPGAVGIEPAAPLAPGEYVFRGVGEEQGGREFTWYAFGVDASPGAAIASAASGPGINPGEQRWRCVFVFCSNR